MTSSPNRRRKRDTNGLLESPPSITTTPTPSPLYDVDVFKHLNDAINGESCGGGASGYVSGEGLWPVITVLSSEHEQEISELRSNVRRLKQLKERIKSREEHITHVEGWTVALKVRFLCYTLMLQVEYNDYKRREEIDKRDF